MKATVPSITTWSWSSAALRAPTTNPSVPGLAGAGAGEVGSEGHWFKLLTSGLGHGLGHTEQGLKFGASTF